MGVDYAAGRPVTYAKNKERVSEAKTKAAKIVSLGKRGHFALNLMRSHVHASALYGTRVNGMSDKVLDDVRALTREAISTRASGGSSRIDLLLQGPKDIDLAFAANCAPLLEWAKRVNMAFYHKDSDTVNSMRTAWSAAIASLYQDNIDGKKVWDSVRGPASACIVTLGRIGWDINLSNAWRVWIQFCDWCCTCT